MYRGSAQIETNQICGLIIKIQDFSDIDLYYINEWLVDLYYMFY